MEFSFTSVLCLFFTIRIVSHNKLTMNRTEWLKMYAGSLRKFLTIRFSTMPYSIAFGTISFMRDSLLKHYVYFARMLYFLQMRQGVRNKKKNRKEEKINTNTNTIWNLTDVLNLYFASFCFDVHFKKRRILFC